MESRLRMARFGSSYHRMYVSWYGWRWRRGVGEFAGGLSCVLFGVVPSEVVGVGAVAGSGVLWA